MRKQLAMTAVVAFLVSAATIGAAYYGLDLRKEIVTIQQVEPATTSSVLTGNTASTITVPDFTEVSEKVLDAVVHIQSSQKINSRINLNPGYRQLPDPFRDFFGEDFRYFFGFPQQPYRDGGQEPRVKMGTGSGVIINEDGYIITNNHVIDKADEINVTLHDNRSFKAIVVGTDPGTDLALLQIDAKDLPALRMVNSDDVKVGEWVLAVGNPFSLNSTVTAGIVSAKARNINILKEKFAIESFIQTDAAINPGNSGGALVNLEGGLIGINTAIQSPTGSFSGYGFAIPSNIVNKVIEDLLNYGVVQRGVLGVSIRSMNGNLAKEKGLETTLGVYVDSLLANSAAGAAGIKPGDVITRVDGLEVRSSPELQEVIARYRPGDQLDVTVDRNGKEKTMTVELRNINGDIDVVTKEQSDVLRILGVELEEADKSLLKKLDLDHGLVVKKVHAGKLKKYTQIKEGFVITAINGKPVKKVEDLVSLLENEKGGVMIEGRFEDIPGNYYYAFGMNS